MATALSPVLAGDFPATVSDLQIGTRTTASSSYVLPTAGTGNATVGVVFVAPTSGRAKVHIAANRIRNDNTAGRTFVSFAIRAGATIGSGTVFLAASDSRRIGWEQGATAGEGIDLGRSSLVTGLTAGATYNARIEMKTNGTGTSTIDDTEIIVEPAT